MMLSFVPRGPGADEPDTATLVARLVRGDRATLAVLYRREAPAVYRYALAMCGNTAWAADATQDAFMAFAAQPHGYDVQRGSLGAYLAGAARHALLAQWRQQRQHVSLDAGEDGTEAPVAAGDDATPETLLVREQDTQALWGALRRLPVPFREAVVLVDLQERPYAEAARIAGIELNTLRTRLHRARIRLAELLGGALGALS